jgi:hypothetical protein
MTGGVDSVCHFVKQSIAVFPLKFCATSFHRGDANDVFRKEKKNDWLVSHEASSNQQNNLAAGEDDDDDGVHLQSE